VQEIEPVDMPKMRYYYETSVIITAKADIILWLCDWWEHWGPPSLEVLKVLAMLFPPTPKRCWLDRGCYEADSYLLQKNIK